MNKAILFISSLIWVSSLVILIIALTDLYPDNIFVEHRSFIGILFIIITGLLKPILFRSKSKKHN